MSSRRPGARASAASTAGSLEWMPATIGPVRRSSTPSPMRVRTKEARSAGSSGRVPTSPAMSASRAARSAARLPMTATTSSASGWAGIPRKASRMKRCSRHPREGSAVLRASSGRGGRKRRAPPPFGPATRRPSASTIEVTARPRTANPSAPRSMRTPPIVPAATSPPVYPRASTSIGRSPARVSSQAAVRPAIPPPTTRASQCSGGPPAAGRSGRPGRAIPVRGTAVPGRAGGAASRLVGLMRRPPTRPGRWPPSRPSRARGPPAG